MTEKELSAMTVLQLRKLAKEQGVVLGAGIDKAGIIQKILNISGETPLNSGPLWPADRSRG